MILLVSVIIPVYNSGKYLRQCLDSVLNQTYKELDVICVDDGSTDDSFGILMDYSKKDSRVRVFLNESGRKGAAYARNYGLNRALGEYVQFVDSDDFFEPDMIEALLTKAVRTGADVVICRGSFFDDTKHRIVGMLPHPDFQYAPDTEFFNWKDCSEYICEIADNYAWNKFFSTKLLTDNDLYFAPIVISEDQFISMIAPIVADRVAIVDKAMINYRIKTGMSLCDSKTEHPEGAFEGIYLVIERLKELGIYDDVKQSYLNVSIRLMREYFDSMTEYDKVVFLYEKYRNEIFPVLGAENLPIGYFHDPRIWDWYHMIITLSLGDILFRSARAFGSKMTTASLRFQAPYDKIKENSKIVLIGKGIAGRYWYSQFLLSDYCEVVYWTDSANEIPDDLIYDSIVRTQ